MRSRTPDHRGRRRERLGTRSCDSGTFARHPRGLRKSACRSTSTVDDSSIDVRTPRSSVGMPRPFLSPASPQRAVHGSFRTTHGVPCALRTLAARARYSARLHCSNLPRRKRSPSFRLPEGSCIGSARGRRPRFRKTCLPRAVYRAISVVPRASFGCQCLFGRCCLRTQRMAILCCRALRCAKWQ